jgi:hypothetical protein
MTSAAYVWHGPLGTAARRARLTVRGVRHG